MHLLIWLLAKLRRTPAPRQARRAGLHWPEARAAGTAGAVVALGNDTDAQVEELKKQLVSCFKEVLDPAGSILTFFAYHY